MQHIKIFCVGDGGIGKTCMLITYTTNQFPDQYVPTVFDNYSCNVMYGGVVYNLGLWDTTGGEDYSRLRPLGYPGTDFFMLCFSLSSPSSLDSITTKWLPEIQHYCPTTPFLIVGLKQDLRVDAQVHKKLEEKKQRMISPEEGLKLARDLKAIGYCECSSLASKGIKEMFKAMMYYFIESNGIVPKEKKRGKLFRFVQQISLSSLQKGEDPIKFNPMPALPMSVFGHTTAIVGTNMYLIGGSNEKMEVNQTLYCYSMITSKWRAMEEFGKLTPLQFHSCVVRYSCFYIFGGKSNGYLNDCYCINTEANTIEKLQQKGDIPSPRYGHSAVLIDGKMIVFGGYDTTSLTCNDLFTYTIETKTWEKVRAQGAVPPSRFMHSAVAYDKAMYVFGGQGDNSALYNDFYKFDTATYTWTKLKVKGKSPSSRFGHSAATVSNCMYLFGGCDKAKHKIFSDLFLFDFTANEWFTPPLDTGNGNKEKDSKEVAPRYNHSAVVDPSNKTLMISGGKDEQDFFSSVFMLGFVPSFVDIFPHHILINILSFLLPVELCNLRVLCKKMFAASEDESLWEEYCKRLCHVHEKEEENKNQTNKEFYREWHKFIVLVPDWTDLSDWKVPQTLGGLRLAEKV